MLQRIYLEERSMLFSGNEFSRKRYPKISMKAVIILYDLKKCNNAQRIKIQNTLYGYIDYSNKGLYKYKRKGIVDKYLHLRLSRGGLIMKDKEKKEVILLLKENKAKIKVIPVNTAESYLKKL